MCIQENSNDFAIYQSPDEEILKRFRTFAHNFAVCVVTQEWHGAFQFLAPWLQKTITSDNFRVAVEERLLEMSRIWEIDELIYPTDFSISYNSCSLNDLKKDSGWRKPRVFSAEMNDEIFRKWMVIQFMPDEEDERTEMDAWFDFWFVIAEVNNELKIGFFEFEDPD